MSKKIITFGNINKSLLYIFLMSASSALNGYIYGFDYIGCFYQMNIYEILHNWILNKIDDCPHHRVFDPFFSYIGMIFIPFIFLREKEEKVKEEDSDEENDENIEINNINLKLIYNDEKKKYLKSIKGILHYILILFLWVAVENLLLIYLDIIKDLDFWFFELIFVSLIYSKTFLSKILSHQKLGMAISIIVGSLLKIGSITLTFIYGSDALYGEHKWLISFVIIYFLLIILRSYVNTQIKILFDLKYISQRFLLASYGIAGVIILGLTGIFTSNVSCSEEIRNYVCQFEYQDKLYYDNFYNYYESGKNMLVRLIVIVLGMVTFFFDKFYSILIIQLYSPVHVIFSVPVQYFLEKIFLLIFTAIFFNEDLFNDKDKEIKNEKIIRYILDETGDIFSIIGFLIYLEIIKLHFCNLDYELSNNIIIRANDEVKESILFIEELKG